MTPQRLHAIRASLRKDGSRRNDLAEKCSVHVLAAWPGKCSGNDSEQRLPLTLCDSRKPEQRQSEEMTSIVVAAERRRGFVPVLLRAVGLADVTV